MRCHIYINKEDESKFIEILGKYPTSDETLGLGRLTNEYIFEDLPDETALALRLSLNIYLEEIGEERYNNLVNPYI